MSANAKIYRMTKILINNNQTKKTVIKMNFKKPFSFVILLFLFLIPVFATITQISPNLEDADRNMDSQDEIPPLDRAILSGASTYPWWDNKYEYRFQVDISSNGVSQDHPPVELFIDFNQYLADYDGLLGEGDGVNTTNIQVIDQSVIGSFQQTVTQFDSTGTDEGDLAWIIDDSAFIGTKTYFVYFIYGDKDNQNNPVIPSSYTRSLSNNPIRLFHNGFENGTSPSLYLDDFNSQSTNFGSSYVRLDSTLSGISGSNALHISGDIWAAQSIETTVDVSTESQLFLTYQAQLYGNEKKLDAIATGTAATLSDPINQYWRGFKHYGDNAASNFVIEERVTAKSVWNYFDIDVKANVAGYDYNGEGVVLNYLVYVMDDDNSYTTSQGLYIDDVSLWNVEVHRHQTTNIQTTLSALETPFASTNVFIQDVDGNPVPNANVALINETDGIYRYSTANSEGMVTFTNLTIGDTYNITANYTTEGVSPSETFNIGTLQNHEIESFTHNVTLESSLWAINFNVRDYDTDNIDKGFVVLYNNTAGNLPVANLTLDSNGNATLRYSNKSSSYDYKVFYETNTLADQTYSIPQFEIMNSTVSYIADTPTHELVVANISTITFNVSGYTSSGTSPLGNGFIEISESGKSIVNATTPSSGIFDFTYLRLNNSLISNYTFNAEFLNQPREVNKTNSPSTSYSASEWKPYLNFTLDQKENRDVLVNFLDAPEYSTKIEAVNFTSGDIFAKSWGEILGFQVNYTYNDGSDHLVDPDIIQYEIYDIVHNYIESGIMVQHSEGIYNSSINTSNYDAGQAYIVEFTAVKAGYPAPASSPSAIINILNLETNMTLFDASTNTRIDSQTINKTWGEVFNVTLVYQLSLDSSDLSGASTVLNWIYDDGMDMFEQTDGTYTNYTFQIDTSKAPSIGTFQFDFSAELNNYSSQVAIFNLDILEIPTTVNRDDYDDPIYIYWEENFTMSLNYTDTFNKEGIEGAYLYYNIVGDPDFNEYPIPETGTSGIYEITLNSTSFGEAGTYTFQIVGQKTNYENQQLWISTIISIVPTSLTAESMELTPYWNQNFTLSLNSTDNYYGRAINDSSITYSASGPAGFSETGSFVFESNGIYEIEFNTTHFSQAGLYTFQISAIKSQYETQELTITVEIQIVPTELTSNHVDDKINKENTDDPFNLSVNFEDTLNTADINDATISYSATGPNDFSETGTIENVGDGTYNISNIDPGILFAGTYTYQITATKNQFTTQTMTVTINIDITASNLTAIHTNNEIDVYWDEDFTLNVSFLEYEGNSPIIGATVSYTITGPSSYSSNGNLIEQGSGFYSKDFDTDFIFSLAGTYTFVISANSSSYESQQITVSLTITTIPMNLSASNTEITVFWEEDFTLSVDLEDGRNSNAITTATVSYSATGTGSYSDSGSLTHDVGNLGIYRITFSTLTFNQAGIFTFVITSENTDHVTQTLTITVIIKVRETSISSPETEIGISYDDSFYLNITLTDISYPASPTGISGATVSYSASGPNSYTRVGTLTYNIDGNYLIQFNAADDFPQEGTYNFLITAAKNQYETQQVSITVNINIINTTLTATEDYINKIAGQSFTLSVLYYNVTDGETPVNGATVSYTSSGYSGASLTEDGTTGNYSIQLNADDFGTGTFTFQITAIKNQFETQQLLITVDIGLDAMNLSVSLIQDPTQIYWNDNFTLKADLEDIGGFLEDATITFTVIDNPNINGSFVEDAGEFYKIEFNSSSFPEAGSYSFEIEATKTNYGTRTKTIIVIIKIVPTNFTSLHAEDTINAHWEEDITIFVNLTDIQDTINPINITDASVTYTAASLAAFSGPLTHSTGSLYYLSFNANDFGGAGSYTIKITAQKNQFETQQLTITVIVDILPTILVNENSDSVGYWKDEVTFSYNFTETFTTTQITDGAISYSVDQIPSLTGSLTHQADGIYTISLNTSQFLSAGTYTIHLEATKFQYQTQTKSLTLTISILPTNISIIAENVVVYWEENFSLLVGYADTHNDINITDAIVSSNLVGSTLYNYPLAYIGNGLYRLEYNTTQFPEAGNYTFQINLGKNQYETQQAWMYVQIKILPTQIVSNHASDSIIIYWEESFTLSVNLTDTYNDNRAITDADIVAYLVGDIEFEEVLVHQNGGMYHFSMQSNIDFTEAGSYTFQIEATKNQYETQKMWIYVDILIVTTELTSNHLDNKIYKLETDNPFNISVSFLDTVNTIDINDATLSYSATGPEDFSDSGTIPHSGNGMYNISGIDPGIDLQSGTYTYQITATKNQYQTQFITITINIDITPTNFTSNHPNNEIHVYWDEDFTLSTTFLVYNGSSPITDATVSYVITGPGSYSGIGSLIDLGTGEYTLNFDTHDAFSLAGTYSFIISANRSNYESQQLTVSLSISTIPMNLSTSNTEISVFWEEEFTLSINLIDGRNGIALTTATVSYFVTGTGSYSDTGTLTHDEGHSGTYRILFSTLTFDQAGIYTFVISAVNESYINAATTITVIIDTRKTEISTPSTEIGISYDDSFYLNITITDISYPTSPSSIDGAIVGYSASGPNSYTRIGTLSYNADGNYLIQFNAADDFPQEGTYNFLITATKNQYETQQVSITVNINIINTTLTATENYINKIAGQSFTLSVLYYNVTDGETPVNGATVSYTLSGYSGASLTEDGTTGNYSIQLNADDFGTGTFTFQITATKNQFATQQLLITVDIGLDAMNLTVSLFVGESSPIYWNDNFTLRADLEDIGGFLEDATITFTVIDNPNINGSFVEDAGEFYKIEFNSSSFPEAGSYSFEIEATKTNYGTRTKTIIVIIKIVPTNFTSLHAEDTINAHWEEDITIFVNLTDIQDINNAINITDASITYTAASLATFSGPLTHSTGSLYYLSFNANNFGGAGSYTIKITAQKNQFETQQLTITVIVDVLPTNLEDKNSDSVGYWKDEITFSYNFTETFTATQITDGAVSYSVEQISSLSGLLSHQGSGIYEVTLNTSQFLSAGTYTINFEATKFQYQPQTTSLILTISILPTNVTIIEENIVVYWEDNFNLLVAYADKHNNINITDAIASSNLVGSTLYNKPLNYIGNGLYKLEYNTTQFPEAGNYTFQINLGKNQYETQQSWIYVQIVILPTHISSENESIVIYWEDSFTLSVHYIDTYNSNRSISGASVSFLQSGESVYRSLNYQGDGTYTFLFQSDTDFSEAGPYEFLIEAKKDQYQTQIFWIDVEILIVPTNVSSNHINNKINKELVDSFQISINVEQIIDELNPTSIPDATATFSVSGPEGYNAQGSLSHIGSGIYNSSTIQASAEYSGIKGTYVYQITITKNQYETQYLTITVNIAVTQTILTTSHQNDEINVYWDENFVLNVSFSLLEDAEARITDGTVSFTMTGPGSYTNSGNLTHIGSGIYQKPFDTDSVFTLVGTYTFYLTATRIDHETQQKSISLSISVIPTNLSSMVGSSFSIFWEESFTISANLTDGRDDVPITSATLQYTTTGTGNYYDTDVLIHQTGTPGIYNLTFNSINFGQTGTYNFLVTSTKSHYVSHQFTVTVNILIRETNFTVEEAVIDITYDESFLINTTYTDISHPANPQGISGAVISYTATGSNNYIMVGELTYTANGQYRFTFVADVVFPQEGTYSFQLIAEKDHYETTQLTITVNVIVVSANLSAAEELIAKSWEENFTLSILYTNITTPESPVGIVGATVSYTISGLPAYSGSLEDLGLGIYALELNTSDFAEFADQGTYVFQITAEKNQFQTRQILISLEMDLKQMNVTIQLVENPAQIFWGDNFTINTDLDGEDGFVSGATVSYSVLDHPTIFGNFSEGGSLYSIQINSTIFPNAGTYTFEIEALNDGYGTRTKSFVVEIKIVPTELISLHTNDTIDAFWNDPITMRIQFTDIQDGGSPAFITGAQIIYTATKLTPYTGNLTYQGDGIYSYSFNANDFGQSGSYSIQIRATKDQYLSQQLVLTVEINIIETSLEANSLNLDAFWLDEVNFTVNFQDITNNEMITNGNVTFSVSQVQGLNGTVSHLDSGIYSIRLDTTQFLKAGEYTIVFKATKFQYETQTLSFILDISILPTEFIASYYNISILWEENLTISTQYADTEYGNNIVEGDVTYTVGQVMGLSGNLTEVSNGKYSIELSSTQFLGVGTYSIFIQAKKYQHQTRDILIYLTINRIDTTINHSIFLQSDIIMNVTTSNIFYFSYIDQYDRNIHNATVAYYELQSGDIITSDTLVYLGNGIYELDLNLELKPVGTYLIVIHLGIENYFERAGSISLKIIKKQITLLLPETLIDNDIEQPEGEDIVIEFELFDQLANAPLTGATVYMEYRNQTYPLEELEESGTYRYVIDTTSAEYKAFFAAETDIATIFVEKANYTMPSFNIGISVTPPEYNFGSVGIPKVFIIIGSAVGLFAMAVYGTTKYVKYLTIPLIVKQLASTRKAISGKKKIEQIIITHTAQEEIYDLFKDDWELLDLDLKEVLELDKKSTQELENLTSEDMPQGGN